MPAAPGPAQVAGNAEASVALATARDRYGLLGRILFRLSGVIGKRLDTAIELVPA